MHCIIIAFVSVLPLTVSVLDDIDLVALTNFESEQENELVNFKHKQDKELEYFKQKQALDNLLLQVGRQKELLSQFKEKDSKITPSLPITSVDSRFKIITEAGALYAIDNTSGLSYKINIRTNSIKIGSQVHNLGLPNSTAIT